MKKTHFEWDAEKDKENQAKHEVSFSLAQHAFLDPHRIIVEDINHKQRGRQILLYRPCRRRHHDRTFYV